MKPIEKLRDETGSTLIAAVVILFIILGLGAAVLSTASVQSHQTGDEASGEAAFNNAEAALDSEANLLMQSWPSAATSACNQSSTPSTFCPGTAVTNSFNTTYAGHWFNSPQWTVQIVGVGGANGESSNYYDDSTTSSAPSYDQSGANKVWIRAQAIIGGQKRVVVAEMVRQSSVVAVPHNTITAGGTYTSNNGNKIIIESKDLNSGMTGPVAVRCGTSTSTPVYGDPCLGWNPGKGQLDPASNYQAGYIDPGGNPYATLSSSALGNLRETAMSQGTYYNGSCPTSLNGLIFIDNPPGGNCSYNGGTWPTGTVIGANGPTSGTPGAIIMSSGTLYFNGNINYYGIIYMANSQGAVPASGPCTTTQMNAETEPVFEVHGTAQLWGSVFVDKCGQVDGGSSKANVNFISTAFAGLTSLEAPALAKNTFRILSNS